MLKAIFLVALAVAVSAKINPIPSKTISFDLEYYSNAQASSMVLTPNGTVFALDGPGEKGSMLALLPPGASNFTYNASVSGCYSTLSFWEEEQKIVYLCQAAAENTTGAILVIFAIGNNTFTIFTDYLIPESQNQTLYTPYDNYVTREGGYYLVSDNNGTQSLMFNNLALPEEGFITVIDNLAQAANVSGNFSFDFFTITNDDQVILFLGENGTLVSLYLDSNTFNATQIVDGEQLAAFGIFRGSESTRDGFLVYVTNQETQENSTLVMFAAFFGNNTVEEIGQGVGVEVGTFDDFELTVGTESVFVALNYLDFDIPAGVLEFSYTIHEGFSASDNTSVTLNDLFNPLMAVDSLSQMLVVAGFNTSDQAFNTTPEFLFTEYSFDQ